MQIQEATLLVKQQVAELELLQQVARTLQTKELANQIALQPLHNVLQELLQAQHVTVLQTKAIQIQEATLLVR